MPSLSLLTQFENRTSSVAKDAKLVNGYGEIESKDKVYTVKRPGYGSGVLYSAAAAQGMINYLDVVRVVVNNRFYKTSSTYVAIDAGGLRVDFV